MILGFVLIFAGVRLAAAAKQTVQNVTLNVDLLQCQNGYHHMPIMWRTACAG